MMKTNVLLLVILTISLSSWCFGQSQLTVTTVNKLSIGRPNQTIEITAKALAPLGEKDLRGPLPGGGHGLRRIS